MSLNSATFYLMEFEMFNKPRRFYNKTIVRIVQYYQNMASAIFESFRLFRTNKKVKVHYCHPLLHKQPLTSTQSVHCTKASETDLHIRLRSLHWKDGSSVASLWKHTLGEQSVLFEDGTQ